MNYKINENIIHDSESMWDLALSFISHYNFIKGQVERSKIDDSIIYTGKVIMKWDENYKKILSDYKKELEFMSQMIYFKLRQENNKLEKFIIQE